MILESPSPCPGIRILNPTLSPLDRFQALGGELILDGEHVRFSAPDVPEIDAIIEELRRDKDAVLSYLRDKESRPPSLEEVKALLPPGVQLISYQSKEAPFAVAPVSIVTNAGRFYRAYIADLRARLEKPEGHHCPPLSDILAKLAEAGLELNIELPEVLVF